MPVYTRKGDEGLTYLASGRQVDKSHSRVELYGSLDQLNAIIGLVIAHINDSKKEKQTLALLDKELYLQQHLLFDLGAELAGYENPNNSVGESVISDEDVKNLEKSMDHMDKSLKPMRNFILPGGSVVSSALHLARTNCRFLERQMTLFMREHDNQDDEQKKVIQAVVYCYINRLSDYFFVAARYANVCLGIQDVPWNKQRLK